MGLWVGGEAIPNTGNSIVGGLTGVVTSRADDAAKLLGTSSLVFNGLAGAAGPLAGFAFGFASEFLLPDPNDARLTALESTTCCLDMRLTALEARLTQQVSRLDTNIALLDKRSVVTPAVEAAGAAVDALSAVRQSITASIREVAHCSDVYSSFVPAECNCAAFSTFVGERASDLSAFTTATGMATRALMMGRSAAFTDHNLNLRPVFNDLISAFIGVLTDVMLLFSAAYTWATRECLHRFATCNSVNCCASKTDSAYCYTDTVLHFTGGRKYTRKLGRCLRVDAQCSHGAHCDNPPLFELVRFQKFVINEIFMQHARMLRGYTILANCGSDAANPTAAMSTVVCGTCYEFGMIKWVPEFLQFDWDWPPARSKLLNDIGPFNDHCAADGFEDTCNTNSIMPLCGAEVEPAKRIVSAGLVADLEASLRSLWKVANMRTLLADQRESAWTIHELSGQRLWTEEKAKQLFYNIADSHVYGEIVLKWPFGHNGQKCTASEDSCGKKFCSHEPPSTPSDRKSVV